MRKLCLILFLCGACGGGGATGGPMPVVALTSPLPNAATDALEIVVRGTADRATSVTVNGNAATSKDGFATWRATVNLGPGENVLVAEARDDAGATSVVRQSLERLTVVSDVLWFTRDKIRKVFYTSQLDPGGLVTIRDGVAYLSDDAFASHDPWEVRNQRGAYSAGRESVYIYDPQQSELVSWYEETGVVSLVSSAARGTGPALDGQGAVLALAVDDARDSVILVGKTGALEIDMDSGNRTEIALPSGNPLGMAHDATNRELYIWHSATNWPVTATNIETGASRVVIPATNWLSGTPFVIDAANNRLLVAVGDQAGPQSLTIQAYDLDTGAPTTLATHDIVRTRGIIYDDGVVYVLSAKDTRTTIHRFDLATGAQSIEFDSARGAGPPLGTPTDLSFDPVRNELVVSTQYRADSALLRVDPQTGDRETWVPFPARNRLQTVAYAATRDEFVVGLEGEIGFIDRSGNETPLVQDLDLFWIEGLVLDDANETGWYFDGDYMTRLELATGARTTHGDYLNSAYSIALDPTRNAVFLRNDDETQPLLELDSAADTLTRVAMPFREIGAIVMSPDHTRLYATDGNQLWSVSPDFGGGALVSGPTMGTGPTIGSARAMVLDPRDENRLYILSTDYQVQIVMVDLETGDRFLVAK